MAEWGNAGAPLLFIYFFHAFAASSTFLSGNIYFLQDSQATFDTNFKNKYFPNPVLGAVPVELPYGTGTAPGRTVQSCTTLTFFHVFHAVAAVNDIFYYITYIFCHKFLHILVSITSRHHMKKGL